jgi:hypothetical protein
MALEIVWRNPILQPRFINDLELIALDRDRSIYIARSADAAVVLRVDQAPTYRRLAEATRAGGA